MKNLMLALLGCILVSFSAFADTTTSTDGYYVGYKKIKVIAQKTNEQFPVALAYPTHTPSKSVKFGPFQMDLAVGAKIASGDFPLVIISHGSGGTNLGYRSIAFALVKQGYVVAIPLHPKNNYQNNTVEGTNQNWRNRPLHISATIDSILSKAKFSANIDTDKIAVIGHSAGGYTALAVAGGVADTTHLIELCRSQPTIDEPFCGLVKANKIKAEKISNVQDKRIKAIVLMAPVGILFKSEDALDKVTIPTLMLRAEKDSELTEPYEAEVIAKNYPNQELLTYCTVANAGHYSFITPFPKAIQAELGVVAQDPTGFDRNAFQQRLSADILTFLKTVLNAKSNKDFQPTSCIEK